MNPSKRALVFVALFSLVCARAACGDSIPPEVVAWAKQFEKIDSISLVWDMERPVVSADGQTVQSLRADVFLKARWPDAMDVQTGPHRQATSAPVLASDPFKERHVYNGAGELLIFSVRGTIKTLERFPAQLDLSKERAAFLDAAPLFAGKWMSAAGIPLQSAKVTKSEANGFEVSADGLGVRLSLVPEARSGGLVLSRIEVRDANGPLLFTHEYSDFRPASGCNATIGYRRRVTLEPRMIPKSANGPEIPRVREDVLIEAAAIPRLESAAFNVSTAGFRERPNAGPAVPAQTDPKPGSAVPKEPGKRSSLMGPSLTSFGIAFLLAGGILVARRLTLSR